MASSLVNYAAAAPSLDIPAGFRPRPLRQARPAPPVAVPPPDGSVGEHGSGEFDFSDVFGPAPSWDRERDADPPAGSGDGAGGDAAPSGDPQVVFNRSHSLVGPSPRPSLVTAPSALAWADIDSALALPPHGGDGRDGDASGTEAQQDLDEGTQADLPVGRGTASSLVGARDTGPGVPCGGLFADAADVPGPQAPRGLGPHDFELLRVVGQGAFGKVFQVRKKDSGEIMAMKVMRKSRIIEKNHGDYMKAEKEILTKVVHPFIVQLHYSFQTPSKLYLLLEFINGGHLFFQLYRHGTFNEDLARLYTAEIVSAVSHLHENGIMHRDLKPENILLDSEGHVKLTDFGLAKEFDGTDSTNSMCGTMEYMAPEILLAKGHGKAADWWSVGILLFEMLTGQPPYCHDNRQKLQQKIVKDKIKFPTFFTAECHNLLKGLLQKEPSKRLGAGPDGSEVIKKHKFFKTINWRKLEARQVLPPFCPAVSGALCTANFDEMWTALPAQDSPATTPSAADALLFKGYTYVAPSLLATVESDSQGEESSEADSDGNT
eukprot:SM000022S07169  [mRNA]  locus=s22:363507:366304:+ [translate_table: standard]